MRSHKRDFQCSGAAFMHGHNHRNSCTAETPLRDWVPWYYPLRSAWVAFERQDMMCDDRMSRGRQVNADAATVLDS
jgi:hypothetical protein